MKRLLNKSAPEHELKTFFIHNGLLYWYASDHSKDFCTLVIPKAWKYMILVETHDKMGHQGNNGMYSLIKRQYYWKGMAKDVKDYIQRCPACRQEKARVQSYPLHMTEIPNRPFDKITMDLVMDFMESNKGNKHILTIIDLLTGWPEAIPIPEPGFKIGDRVYFKNKTPGKWDLKWRAGYRIVQIECEGCYLHIENQATGKIRSCNVKDIVLEPVHELWNMNLDFGRASKFINHPDNLPDFTPDT